MTVARTRIGKVTMKPQEDILDDDAMRPIAHAINEEGLIGYAGDPTQNALRSKDDGWPIIQTAEKRGLIELVTHVNVGPEHVHPRDIDLDRRAYQITDHGKAALKRTRS